MRCLGNLTFVAVGDSNGRLTFEAIVKRTGCVIQNNKFQPGLPHICLAKQANFKMYYEIHEMPYHGAIGGVLHKNIFKSPINILNEIPSKGRYVVFVHIYLHYTCHHYALFAEEMHRIREASERALARNSDLRIILRGPHALTLYEGKGWTFVGGNDIAVEIYDDIIRKEFEPLKDKVYYILPWNMTIAIPGNFHPNKFVYDAISGLILEKLCFS